MSYSTQGASNRPIYDCCDYAQSLQQSVDPLQYNLYFGAQENCSKCIDKKAWFKQDLAIVDIESDLLNLTRPLSNCDQYKYNPNCKASPECISTFDPNVPVILSPSLCPIVYNNIPVQTNPGYTLPNPNICSGKNEYREADSIDTFADYTANNNAILGNNADPQDVYLFLNSCSNKPLYQGAMYKVSPYLNSLDDSAPILNPNIRKGVPRSSDLHKYSDPIPFEMMGISKTNIEDSLEIPFQPWQERPFVKAQDLKDKVYGVHNQQEANYYST